MESISAQTSSRSYFFAAAYSSFDICGLLSGTTSSGINLLKSIYITYFSILSGAFFWKIALAYGFFLLQAVFSLPVFPV